MMLPKKPMILLLPKQKIDTTAKKKTPTKALCLIQRPRKKTMISKIETCLQEFCPDSQSWKQCYRENARKYHPDKKYKDPNAVETFQRLNDCNKKIKDNSATNSEENVPVATIENPDAAAKTKTEATAETNDKKSNHLGNMFGIFGNALKHGSVYRSLEKNKTLSRCFIIRYKQSHPLV